ncbi:hypothetical protein COR50_13340 [Chitinophaga caeni]|uniref:RagB/SusD family nutrient uptake outer membrane protein n=1 Tax=Chitinophaga caeni TaxID=2029983 RepID=A0A291QVK1_9BACT|nr:RagB/SusD family nutrient uptake outer membrane protein [Chitinophaga caeni]ATL48069.1 hypothetical protein COR50_13340 [Chitinophaga caeni]
MSRIIIIFSIFALCASCKKFVELTPPDTSLEADKVFQSDITGISAVTSILGELGGYNSFSQGFGGISIVSGLVADELTTVSIQPAYQEIYTNTLLPGNTIIAEIWNRAYKHIYATNAIIEGASRSTALSTNARNQILGEAYFLRSFLYFQLVNLFGDVPFLTGTDYEKNLQAAREPVKNILNNIAEDLKLSKSMLSVNYLDNTGAATTKRIRPNKWAATALLARVYLYLEDWPNSELQANEVISQAATYILDPNLNNVFKPGTREAIWHLPPGITTNGQTLYTGDGSSFSVNYIKSFGVGPQSFGYDLSNYIPDSFVALFEPGDARKSSWIDSLNDGTRKYYVPYKYKTGIDAVGTLDYLMVLRLSEQYLVRAEARLGQNNFDGARQDIDTVRSRARLLPTTVPSTRAGIMAAIEHERQLELFLEWGQRWMDLKRWPGINNPAISRAEEIMSVVTPVKGGVWDEDWLRFPIPVNEVRNGPNMSQNDGYPQ